MQSKIVPSILAFSFVNEVYRTKRQILLFDQINFCSCVDTTQIRVALKVKTCIALRTMCVISMSRTAFFFRHRSVYDA